MSSFMTGLSFEEEVSDWTAIAHLAEARNQISRIRHFGHALYAVSFFMRRLFILIGMGDGFAFPDTRTNLLTGITYEG